jgi:TonB-dependent starch-binding outer membrane protein SusC
MLRRLLNAFLKRMPCFYCLNREFSYLKNLAMRKYFLIIMFCIPPLLGVAQTRTITGKVTDEKGNPVVNASVQIKGSEEGTTTNEQGEFSLRAGSNARILTISSTGFGTQEVELGNRTNVVVSLLTEEKRLDEVVIVAYGSQVKKKITGAVTKVEGKQFENVPLASADQMLQGKVAGVQSVAPNGQPGSLQQIRIRGIGSITAASQPLFVVDGVPVNSGDFTITTVTSNQLAGINPNDIESMTVLKDASAASIYGSRAANGVILINTKKGRAGKTKIRVDGEFGFNDPAVFSDNSEPLNREQYLDLTREGLVNAGANDAQIAGILDALGASNDADYDWIDLVTRQGSQQQINLSASGGDNKTTFFASAGYFKQEAVVINSDFKRYSANLSLRHQVSNKIAIGAGANISFFNQKTPDNGGAFRNPVLAGYFLRPTQEAYNPDGTVNYDPAEFNQTYNPLAIAEYDKQLLRNIKGVGSIYGEYNILRDLKFTTRYGVDYFNLEEFEYQNPFFGDARTVGGRIIAVDTRVFNWVWTNTLDYHWEILQERDLNADIKVGYEAQESEQYRLSLQGEGIPQTTELEYPATSVPKVTTVAGSDYTFASLFSVLQFNLQNKYSLSGSLRRDGSSRFGSNNRYGTFWSVGGAWNMDQENFMRGFEFISALKLRASYGVNGNAGIGNYDWQPTYIFGANYNQLPGSAPNNVGNPNLTWELNKPLNIGLEAGLLKNRLNIVIDYYNRKTSDLLLADPLSLTSGFPSINDNIGAMVNKGWEFTVNAIPISSNDFRWDISFNIALNENEITALRNNADIVALPYIRRVGEDFQSIYTRLWAGVDPQTGNPLWYTDASKNTTTSNFAEAQRVIIGSASPKAFGGFNTIFTYKGISLDAQFNYQFGNKVSDTWGFIMWSDGAFPTLNKITKQLDRWQKPGDITANPKYVYNNNSNSNAASDRFFYKGDFIRLRNLTLAYQLPRNVLSKIKLDNATFYVRGTNLWTQTFDDNLVFDPEQPIDGANNLQVLIQRSVTFGLNLGF